MDARWSKLEIAQLFVSLSGWGHLRVKNDRMWVELESCVLGAMYDTSASLKLTGNYNADKLATEGLLKSKERDTKKIQTNLENILAKSIILTHHVDEKLLFFE